MCLRKSKYNSIRTELDSFEQILKEKTSNSAGQMFNSTLYFSYWQQFFFDGNKDVVNDGLSYLMSSSPKMSSEFVEILLSGEVISSEPASLSK